MPNAPKTPTRTFRISNELWADLQQVTKEQGTTVSAIVVEFLTEYVQKHKVHYGDWQ